MDETNWHFQLRFTGDHKWHPDGSYSLYRSDNMLGGGGRLLVGRIDSDDLTEVPYRDLSLFWMSDVIVEGVPVARVRRAFDGTIVGEWIHPATDRAAISPHGTAPPQAPGGVTRIAQSLSGDTMANALQLAGALLSHAPGKGWQALGSLLSSVSKGIGQSSGPQDVAGDAAPKRLSGYEPGSSEHGAQGTSQGDAGPGREAAPEVRAEVERAVASPAVPGGIPALRSCDGCAHFRPYVRISERLTEELGPSIHEEVVARALNDLVSQEEKGKGEEARLLADLFRQGKDRWGNRRPSFFSYCAAHERDQREATIFIAQIRNADHRCRPVKHADGRRWSDAQTDFSPSAPTAHSCNTCVHRIKAAGPGEDAREIREIVSKAVSASNLAAGVGHKGTDFGASLLSSYPDAKRKNAATARAREIAEVFARRGSDSHASTEPRYLDRCGLKSDLSGNRHRVCAVENPHDRCPDWRPVEAR